MQQTFSMKNIWEIEALKYSEGNQQVVGSFGY